MQRLAILSVLLAACSSDTPPPHERTTMYGGSRPVELEPPAGFDEDQTYPLVLVLHGYSANGFVQEVFFQMDKQVEAGHAFVLAPDGNVDSQGHQFWNADPACCDFDGANPDDAGYLGGLVDAVKADWPIDLARVFIVGHSNGGFMAYRMACERADLFAAIGVLAGAASSTPSACNPTAPVSVVHLHGTMDEAVPFAAAAQSVDQWAGKDGCGTTKTPGTTALDLESSIAGAETTIDTVDGCPAGVGIEQWTITGATHIPNFVPGFGQLLFDWFTDHAR